MSAWPQGVVAGEACPNGAGTDQVHLEDTATCTVASAVVGMCPCRALLAGWADQWFGYDAVGNALARADGGPAEAKRQAALLRPPAFHSDHIHGDGGVA